MTSKRSSNVQHKRRKSVAFCGFQTAQSAIWQENLTQLFQETASKALEIDFAVRHAFETESTFWLEANLHSLNLASQESYGQENVTELFQETGSEALLKVREGSNTLYSKNLFSNYFTQTHLVGPPKWTSNASFESEIVGSKVVIHENVTLLPML